MAVESRFVQQDAEQADNSWFMRNRKIILALMATSVLATTGVGFIDAAQTDFMQGPTQAVQVTNDPHGLQQHYEIQIASGKNGGAVDMAGSTIISSVAKAAVGAPLFSGKMCTISFNAAANGTGTVSDFTAKGHDFEYNAFTGLHLKAENASACDTAAVMGLNGSAFGSLVGYITEARQDITTLETLSNLLTPAEITAFQAAADKVDSNHHRFPGQPMGINHQQVAASASLNKLREKLGEDQFDSGLTALIRQGSLEQAKEKYDDMVHITVQSASTYGVGDSRSLREQLLKSQVTSPMTAQAQSKAEQSANFSKEALPYILFFSAPLVLGAGLMAPRSTESKKQSNDMKPS